MSCLQILFRSKFSELRAPMRRLYVFNTDNILQSQRSARVTSIKYPKSTLHFRIFVRCFGIVWAINLKTRAACRVNSDTSHSWRQACRRNSENQCFFCILFCHCFDVAYCRLLACLELPCHFHTDEITLSCAWLLHVRICACYVVESKLCINMYCNY